jgi:hypothetical protein
LGTIPIPTNPFDLNIITETSAYAESAKTKSNLVLDHTLPGCSYLLNLNVALAPYATPPVPCLHKCNTDSGSFNKIFDVGV